MEKNARPAKHEILVGKNKWVSKKEWQAAIRARKNGTATKEQKEILPESVKLVVL